MDVIFEGAYDGDEAIDNLSHVIQLFKDRYKITHFREVHLSLTLLDAEGEDVELVDTETAEVYRTFEVHQNGDSLKANRHSRRLRLVVDNT